MDVCIVVVINVNLMEVIVEGCFCEDLYYCLNIVFIKIFFLCECGDDIILFFCKFVLDFVEKYCMLVI